jgi:hypothetical protein
MEWKEQSVFISSTFNDMHAERDYLMKNVFPQLGEWCERRHIVLREIDLRWGVPPADENNPEMQNTVFRCLKAVDSCRPFSLPAGTEARCATRRTPENGNFRRMFG